MKYSSVLSGVLVLALAFATVSAQNATEFTDPAGRYKLTLIGDWRAVSYNDAVGRPKTEFVYRDRSEGLLKIYRPGFEGAAREPFGGGPLNGIRLSFFSTEGNRKIANTYYYLQDKNAMWVLRFSGKRGSLDAIRNLTDQIARSFRPL